MPSSHKRFFREKLPCYLQSITEKFIQRALFFNYAITFSQVQTDISINYCDVIVNLEQLGKRIPDVLSVKLTVSSAVNFYFTKNENRTKKISNTALTILLWVQVLLLPENTDFLQKYTDISKIKRTLVLKGIFSKTSYVFVITYQITSFQHNSNEFQTGVYFTSPPPPATLKRTPKKLTKIRVKAYNII